MAGLKAAEKGRNAVWNVSHLVVEDSRQKKKEMIVHARMRGHLVIYVCFWR